MFKRVFLLIIAFLSFTFSFAIQQDSISVKRERFFKGAALYGFMNGGSDLFLEYGFKELRALEVSYKSEDYSIEVYEMSSPEDAFGIYSLHTFRCLSADSLSQYDCMSRFQLQTVVANKYVSIVFGAETRKAREGARELLCHYFPDYSENQIKIPELLITDNVPVSGSVKFMRGNLAVSDVDSDLANIVKNINSYNIWYKNNRNSGEKLVLLTFSLRDDKEVIKLLLPANAIKSEGEEFLFFSF